MFRGYRRVEPQRIEELEPRNTPNARKNATQKNQMQSRYGRPGPPTSAVVMCYELQYLTSVTTAHTLPRSALEWTDTLKGETQ